MEIFKTDDWKKEKHVPVIEILENKDGKLLVRVIVGKDIPHPNTTEHHIRYVELFFFPENEQFPYNIGRVDFNSHGESIKGANTSEIYSEPVAYFVFKNRKKGTLVAFSYCNIHGLWKSEEKI